MTTTGVVSTEQSTKFEMSEFEDTGLGAACAGGEVGRFVHGVGTAAVTCKAGAAVLCGSWDADIHAANPLASRHERVPVIPFYERPPSVVRHRALSSTSSSEEMKPGRLFVPSVLGRRLFSSHGHQLWIDPTDFHPNHHHYGQCCSVLLQGKIDDASSLPLHTSSSSSDFDHYPPKNSQCYNFTLSNASHNQSISSRSPCLDVDVVPSGANISFSEGTADYSATAAAAAAGMDREARVLRYREKRKSRRFEKTTRHASRKAYAESRPRIKGRFAKRTESEIEAGRIYSSAVAFLAADSGFGVVPSL